MGIEVREVRLKPVVVGVLWTTSRFDIVLLDLRAGTAAAVVGTQGRRVDDASTVTEAVCTFPSLKLSHCVTRVSVNTNCMYKTN